MRSTAKRLMVVAMAMAMVVALPAVALAHHPLIAAEADCKMPDGSWYVHYTAEAWEWTDYWGWATNDQRTNNDVRIEVNGVEVFAGAFNLGNDFTISGSFLVVGADSATVKVIAVPKWGPGEDLGQPLQSDEITVPMPPDCVGTGTPGYWHKIERWTDRGIDGITIGGVDYTAEEAVDLINAPVKGDKTLTMFPALVAAKLNVQIGNPSFCIADTIAAADAWMADNGPAGSGVKANSDAWDVGEPLYTELDDYNNGYLCAPHRD